jgi:hypothetical protein
MQSECFRIVTSRGSDKAPGGSEEVEFAGGVKVDDGVIVGVAVTGTSTRRVTSRVTSRVTNTVDTCVTREFLLAGFSAMPGNEVEQELPTTINKKAQVRAQIYFKVKLVVIIAFIRTREQVFVRE